ncbi:hypothetical protein N7528_004472 [Penicillium herquei]|nr:hypothetical protein N7528_004472 [Penicillium herquei]
MVRFDKMKNSDSEYMLSRQLVLTGKWYCSKGLSARLDEGELLHNFKKIYENQIDLDEWIEIPFPYPLAVGYPLAITVNHDTGIINVRVWNAKGAQWAAPYTPRSFEADLATVCNGTAFALETWHQEIGQYCLPATCTDGPSDSEFTVLSDLPFKMQLPSTMFELQQQFFMDFLFVWRNWIGDPFTWPRVTPVFHTFATAFLRLAAWDFEICKGSGTAMVRTSSYPQWSCPKSDMWWFHGFLVVLQGDINSDKLVRRAMQRAKTFLDTPKLQKTVRCILLSPRDVIIVELSQHTAARTKCYPLLHNLAVSESSPGFRLLAQVLCANRCTKEYVSREIWLHQIPPEIITLIFDHSTPRDALALAQASFVIEESYYASLPQLSKSQIMGLKTMPLSISCCGNPAGLEDGVLCSECLRWHHRRCAGTDSLPSADSEWICLPCQKGLSSPEMKPGEIHKSTALGRKAFCIRTSNGDQMAQLRDLESSNSRHESNFELRFNGMFSGLAYFYYESAGSKRRNHFGPMFAARRIIPPNTR